MNANTDSTNAINTIKIKADVADFNSPVDESTNSPVRFRRGDTIQMDAVFYNRGIPADLTSLTRINLEILDIGQFNSPEPRVETCLLRKVVQADEINKTLSADDIQNGLSHVSICLDSDETSITAGQRWLRIVGFDSDAARTTFLGGWIYVEASYGDTSASPLPESNALDRQQASAMFASRAANLSDLTDIASTRDNLNVYSKSEVDTTTSSIAESAATHSRLAANNNQVRLSGGKAVVNRTDIITSLPLSMFVTYDIDSLENLGYGESGGINFFNNMGAIWTTPWQMMGVWFYCDSRYGLQFCCGNQNPAPATSRVNYATKLSIPLGRHSVGVCVGSGVSDGVLDKIMFYIDGRAVGSGSASYKTLVSANIASSKPLVINSKINYASTVTAASNISMSLSRPLIANFEMDTQNSPYTPADYDGNRPIPQVLKNPDSEQKILLSLDGDLNAYQWRDTSGGERHAVIYGEAKPDRNCDYCTQSGSYVWASSTSAGAFILGDTPVLPPNCRVEIFGYADTSGATFSFGDSSSSDNSFIASVEVGTSWMKIGEFFTGANASKLYVKPSSAGRTLTFSLKMENLK